MHCLQNFDLCIRACLSSSRTFPNIRPKSKWLKLKIDIKLLSKIPSQLNDYESNLSNKISTDHIPKTFLMFQGHNSLLFLETESNVDYQHQSHHSIVVSHCQVCAEHPGVVSEHPGPEYNQSGAGITDHLQQENSKMFCIQGLIFTSVP